MNAPRFAAHFHRLLLPLLLGIAGCGSGTTLYGPKSCAPDEHLLAAYPTANGSAAVCIAKERVEFMLCVRELGLSNVLVDKASSTNLTIAVPNAGDASGTVDIRSQEKKQTNFAVEGDLAKARADMIRACLNMLPSHQQAVAPPPQPVPPSPAPGLHSAQ